MRLSSGSSFASLPLLLARLSSSAWAFYRIAGSQS